ncbi:MAG: hypothetical protein M0Q42_12975 [Xanthomonadales bacterium]|nr:hypothetical protein [Xanthomonadales bacterium]
MNVSLYRILACTVVVLAPTAALSQGAPDEKINVQCIVDSQVYQATADDMSVGPDGTVKLQGIADCGPESGGTGPGEAPATLSIDFNTDQTPGGSITIPASQQSAPVPVHAVFQGYGAGAPFFQDSCTASAGAGNLATVSPAQPSASFTLGVGNHTLSLGCSRSFGAAATQNLNVVPVPTMTRQVSIVQEGGGDPPPTGCPAIPSYFSGGTPVAYTAPYNQSNSSGGWANPGDTGFHPGQGTGHRVWRLAKTPTDSLWSTSVQLRVWEFTAPANTGIWMNEGDISSGKHTLSISECPGAFLQADLPNNQTTCQSGGAGLVWATGSKQHPARCNLEAGKKYYINMAAFDMNHYLHCMASPGSSQCFDDSVNPPVYRPLRNESFCVGDCSAQFRLVPQ